MLLLARSRLFSNLSDVVAHRRKGERAERRWREREKEEKGKKKMDEKIQLLVFYINSLKRERKRAMLLSRLRNRREAGGGRGKRIYRYEISVLFCFQMNDIDCVVFEVFI